MTTEGSFREALDLVRRGYLRFLPAVASTWILVEGVAPQVPRAPDVARIGLLLLSVSLYTAAAASVRTGRGQNPVWLGLSRASGAIDLFLIALAIALLVGIGLGVGILVGGDTAVIVGAALSGLVGLALLCRLWPILAVPYLYDGRIVWSPAARGSLWSGPGLGTAWRMTSRPGTFVRKTAPVLATSLVLLAVPLTMRIAWETGFFDSLLFYAIVLPLVTTRALLAAEALTDRPEVKSAGSRACRGVVGQSNQRFS